MAQELEKLNFVDSVKIIPILPENRVYVAVQLSVLGLCILSAIMCTIMVRKKSSEPLYVLILFAYLPILETYPTIYVWYDYNTNDNLATDSHAIVSMFILLIGLAKVAFYFGKLTFISVRSKSTESKEWIYNTN